MSRVQRRDNTFRKDETRDTKVNRILDIVYSNGGVASTDDLDAHAAIKTGVHGIPTMSNGQGLLWNGTTWVATDLATQSELNSVDSLPSNAVFLVEAQGAYGAGTAASNFWVTKTSTAIANATNSATAPEHFRWDSSDWLRSGKTTWWWMHAWMYTNSASFGTITYTIGTRKISSVGGAAGGITWSMVASDPDAKSINFVNPTGGSSLPSPTSFNPPPNGNYAAYVANSVTTPANSWVSMGMRLYVFWN